MPGGRWRGGGGQRHATCTRLLRDRPFARRHCPRVTHTHGYAHPTARRPPTTPRRPMGGNIIREAFPGNAAAHDTVLYRGASDGAFNSYSALGHHLAPRTRRIPCPVAAACSLSSGSARLQVPARYHRRFNRTNTARDGADCSTTAIFIRSVSLPVSGCTNDVRCPVSLALSGITTITFAGSKLARPMLHASQKKLKN